MLMILCCPYVYYHITILTFLCSTQKLEWQSLSIDLLPHPDMFTEATLDLSEEGSNLRDDDGAKRVFFGGERFIEGISGEAYVSNAVSLTCFNHLFYYSIL